jgi:hypothetical protein
MASTCRALCRFRILPLVTAAGWMSLTGCGPGMPKTYPLRGRVVFKGGPPLSGGSIAFESTGEPRWHGGAEVGPDGTFAHVMTVGPDGKGARGLVEGEHRVRIDLGRGDPGEGRPRVRVPARYLGFEKSPLMVRVPAPGDEVTFELERDGSP